MGLGFGSIPDLSNRMLTRLAGVGWPLVKNFHERLSLSILLRLRGEEENFASICWVVAPRQMSPAFCSRLEQTPLAFSLSPSPSPSPSPSYPRALPPLHLPLALFLLFLSLSLSPSPLRGRVRSSLFQWSSDVRISLDQCLNSERV